MTIVKGMRIVTAVAIVAAIFATRSLDERRGTFDLDAPANLEHVNLEENEEFARVDGVVELPNGRARFSYRPQLKLFEVTDRRDDSGRESAMVANETESEISHILLMEYPSDTPGFWLSYLNRGITNDRDRVIGGELAKVWDVTTDKPIEGPRAPHGIGIWYHRAAFENLNPPILFQCRGMPDDDMPEFRDRCFAAERTIRFARD